MLALTLNIVSSTRTIWGVTANFFHFPNTKVSFNVSQWSDRLMNLGGKISTHVQVIIMAVIKLILLPYGLS